MELRILMKEGFEGETPTIENIEGIVVPMLSGEDFLVYPKYSELPLISSESDEAMPGSNHALVEALYDRDNHEETSALCTIGSPAAEYVRKFGKDLPSPLMLAAIIHHRSEIDAAAGRIEGADKLKIFSHLWSCCRCYSYGAWYAYGSVGFFFHSYLYSSYSVVPVAYLKVRKAND